MKNFQLTTLGISLLMFAFGGQAQADFLPNNFWINSTFENGTNLDQVDGTVTNWNRGGSDPTICQVITNNAVSPRHALAVVDTSDTGYGEWYSDVDLIGHASPGDALNIQWYQMYDISGGEMRLTVLFFDATNSVVGTTHFVVNGQSTGWQGAPETSSFTKRNEALAVPLGAVRMRCSLVSGGSEATTGSLIIDDLSVARVPQPTLLSGNFWLNPSFELGSNLDQTTGTLTNWSRGGSDPAICQVITNNFASATHALAVVDTNAAGYGEWYSDLPLAGHASPGDVLNIQWFEMFSITNGEMRLTVLFLDAADRAVGTTHFTATGQSAGWQGTIESSGFVRRNQSLAVPAAAVKMRCSLVSGGSEATVGVMVIDDLSVALPARAALLAGNFWLNSTFEEGTSLDQSTGTPAHWNRGGSDPTIAQMINTNFTSAGHALALIDTSTNGYGEWYSDLSLSGIAGPGSLVDVQWFELYGITNGEMRVTVQFFGTNDTILGETHFTATGQSPGWLGTIVGSPFTMRKGQVVVPDGATRMRFDFVSGGPEQTTGVMAIDDLSAAIHVIPPTVLAGNFFPNPTFEDGVQLDDPLLGTPSGGWQRGGSASAIDQVTTNNFVSPTHALVLADNDPNNYGEWYLFLNVSNLVSSGDTLDLQWYQIYSTTNGSMRLSLAFLDPSNNTLANQDFNVTDQSPGWTGTIVGSPFERQIKRLTVPDGTTQLRVNFASGGASSVTGVTVIDDLSVRRGQLSITDITRDSNGVKLTWLSSPGKTYTVQFTSALSAAPTWTPLATNVSPDSADGFTATYSDTATHAGTQGFYRILQE
jgi:hypothetical protein